MNPKKLLYRGLATGINMIGYVAPARAGQLAFGLFATPPPARVRPKELEFLQRAERLDQTIAGYRIPVYQWGPADGPIVFCTYGWGYNAGRWRHYVPELVTAGYRVVAFDPPGHGLSTDRVQLTFPLMATLQAELIRRLGGIDQVLGHSFGGSCLTEGLTYLPSELRPSRICLMAVVSEVRWLFAGFAQFMGFREPVYAQMQQHIVRITGRSLDEFDVSRVAPQLSGIPTLLIHDPRDQVTAYRNARRNHSHWLHSWLYSPEGAGHHLGTSTVTQAVLTWIIKGAEPAGAVQNTGSLPPLPAVVDPRDMEVEGVTNFFG